MRVGRTITTALVIALCGAAAFATPALGDDSVSVAGPESAPYAAGDVLVRYDGQAGVSQVGVPAGATVPETVRRLNADPSVASAQPDFVASGSAFPNDPGMAGVVDGWRLDQWSFLGSTAGIDAPGAWSNLGAPQSRPGSGVTVAVVDSGVAYRSKGKRFARDPDLAKGGFAPGKDFVQGDSVPLDENGHGTHVASTIAEQTGNALGETGIAYGATVMPVRVLDRDNVGRASDIAKGIRWAARHGADVINLSLNFGPGITHCSQVSIVCSAIRGAVMKRGAVVVVAAGNDGGASPEMPAAAPRALSVSASTDQGCLSATSNTGASITAPGGGSCTAGGSGAPIYQYSLDRTAAQSGDYAKFGFVGLSGTSQAAAEASGAAALVIASGVRGSDPSPLAVAKRLGACARPRPAVFGAGLLDVARATSPGGC